MHVACPHCRNPIEVVDAAPLGEVLCPSCGSSFRLEQGPTVAQTVDAGPQKLGKFLLMETLGMGAFGTVYKARDPELDRTVAIKVPRTGNVGSGQHLDRFLREARSVAQLRHPSIVPVHEVGEWRAEGVSPPVPYLVSEYVEGVTLADYITAKRLTFRESAELIAQLAEALQYAHDRGVVHRDVKPSNIMLERQQTRITQTNAEKNLRQSAESAFHSPLPRLMDFGLAKRDAGEITMTVEGQILGTPAYMSPEQARGEAHKVDAKSDVYSLGVILYELLTGELPFRGNTRMLLHQVLHDEPRPPRSLNDRIPRDLDTICVKALAKEPSRRFQTAGDLADDLRRFLKGESIQARPVGAWERGWRWAKRRPAPAALVAVIVLAAVTLLVGGWWHNVHLRIAKQLAEDRRQQADDQRAEAQRERARAVTNLYHSRVREVRALRLARADGYRSEAWKLLQEALQLESPDKDVMSLRREAMACLGDIVGQEPTTWTDFSDNILALALRPNGKQLAVGLSNGAVSLRDVATGSEIARWREHRSPVGAVAFSPDGEKLISGDRRGIVKVWEPSPDGRWVCARTLTREPEVVALLPSTVFPFFTPWLRPPGLTSLAVSPDGKQIAACSESGTAISLCNLADGTFATGFSQPGDAGAHCVAFSPRDGLLAVGYARTGVDRVLIWDVFTHQLRRVLSPDLSVVHHVAFSPDGRLLACTCSEGVAVFDVPDFQRRLFLRGDQPRAAAFSPDSQFLAVAGQHLGAIRLWNVSTNREVAVLRHADKPHLVAYGADGGTLVAASPRAVRVWNLTGSGEKLSLPGHARGIPGIAFSPDGKQLASAGKDNRVTLWDPVTGQALRSLAGFGYEVQAVAFSPDGRLLATGDWAGGVKVWDAGSGKKLASLDHDLGRLVWSVGFSPDGRYFAAGGWQGATLRAAVWRVLPDADGVPGFRLLRQDRRPSSGRGLSLAFSPDGAALAWTAGNTLQLWDPAESRDRPFPRVQLAGSILSTAFFPDGKHLVFVADTGAAEVWDWAAGRRASTFGGGAVPGGSGMPLGSNVALSADGAWLASNHGQFVSIWDTNGQKLLAVLPEEQSTIWCLAWSPDKRLLAVGSSDGSLVIWNIPKIRGQLAEIGLDW